MQDGQGASALPVCPGMAGLVACGGLRSPEVSWLVVPSMGKGGGGCLSCKLKPYNICVKSQDRM